MPFIYVAPSVAFSPVDTAPPRRLYDKGTRAFTSLKAAQKSAESWRRLVGAPDVLVLRLDRDAVKSRGFGLDGWPSDMVALRAALGAALSPTA